MRGLLMITEVGMLGAGLGLIWFGSESLRTPKSPEAGRILDEAIVLTEQVDNAIAEAESLRASGEIELVYRPLDRKTNASQEWNVLRVRLAKWISTSQLASLEDIDFANDPAGSRAKLARMNSNLNGRAISVAAFAVAGGLILGVVVLERRRKQAVVIGTLAVESP